MNYASSGCAQNNLPKFKDGLEIFLTGHGPITGQLDDTLAAVLASHGPMPKAKVLDALLGVIQSTFGFIAADRTKVLPLLLL